MSLFSGKKLFLFGFIVVLLVAIPLTVYLAQQQQKTKSNAEKSTILSLVESGKTNKDITTTVGQNINLDVMVNPGNNFVSYVKLTISYDPTKIATASPGIVANSDTVSIFEGPTYGPSQVSITLATGGDQTKVIQTATKIATITFNTLTPTETAPTQVGFGSDAEVLSTAPSDTSKENVLSTTNPAAITITGETTTTTNAGTTTTTVPGETTTTTNAGTTTTTVPGETTTTTTLPNQSPICSSLVLDREATGAAPLAINFTANGNDTDGTISKVTFNFGDGTVNDVTTGGGIGTQIVNVQANHIYNNSGTFSATAIITDSQSGASATTNCSQVISVITASGDSPVQPTVAPLPTATPTIAPIPTIAPTGPGDAIMTIGALGAIFTIIGAILLFAL